MKEIYLDNAATTKVDHRVAEKMMAAFTTNYGNPSSLYSLGIKAEKSMNAVRKSIAQTLNCDAQEIYFTSGGTEGNNMIIKGIVENKKRKRTRIITTATEHPSVLDVFNFYDQHNVEVKILKVDQLGRMDLDELRTMIDSDTVLVSVMGVNNEIGTMQDLKSIGELIKGVNSNCLFHTDFVQGYMKVPLNVKQCKIDALTFCGHKIFGPKGVGGIYLKKGIQIKPLIHGGGQEKNLRSGTENVPGIIGLGEAIEIRKNTYIKDLETIRELRNYFITGLNENIEDIKINGDPNGSPYLLNVSFNHVRGEILLHSLEAKNIFVSTGSACSSHKKEKQYVLKEIGLMEEYKEGTIRISFSQDITKEDVDYAVAEITQAVKTLRLLIRPQNRK